MKDVYSKKMGVKEYHSPIPEIIPTKIVYPTGEYAHEKSPISKYAKDFLISVGTPIEAMEGGKVIFVKDDSDKYGLGPKYANDANIVAVEHKDGTMLEYIHMGKNKVSVKVGDNVRKGQVLGFSGLSGCMSEPHLHANKFERDEDGKPVSIPYDVEGIEDERRTNRSSGGSLENITGGVFVVSIGITLLFFSGITGNVVGVTNNSFYGLIFVFMSLISGGVWVFLKKRITG